MGIIRSFAGVTGQVGTQLFFGVAYIIPETFRLGCIATKYTAIGVRELAELTILASQKGEQNLDFLIQLMEYKEDEILRNIEEWKSQEDKQDDVADLFAQLNNLRDLKASALNPQ